MKCWQNTVMVDVEGMFPNMFNKDDDPAELCHDLSTYLWKCSDGYLLQIHIRYTEGVYPHAVPVGVEMDGQFIQKLTSNEGSFEVEFVNGLEEKPDDLTMDEARRGIMLNRYDPPPSKKRTFKDVFWDVMNCGLWRC